MLTYEKNLTTGITREYAYLNDQIIGWKETDSTGNSVKRYAATDLLGSVTAVTDESGRVLWSGEYTAFGNVAYGSGDVLYDGMYTGKDIDSETGLTYHWNRWRSEDGSSFISEDPARDRSNWYGYCGNNPINFTDPTGLEMENIDEDYLMTNQEGSDENLGYGNDPISEVGCVITAYTRIANDIAEQDFTLSTANDLAKELDLFTTGKDGIKNELTPENGAKLINALLDSAGIKKEVLYSDTIPTNDMTTYGSALNELQNSPDKYYVTARVKTENKDKTKTYDHTVNINNKPVIPGNIEDTKNALNVKICDTCGVRNQISEDIRKNILLRSDYFRVVNKGIR